MKQQTGLFSNHNQTCTTYRITHTIVGTKIHLPAYQKRQMTSTTPCLPVPARTIGCTYNGTCIFTACNTCCSCRFLDFQRTSTKHSTAARSSSHERTSPHLGILPSL
ncbi:unnamed protein product [Ectocarpus sp. 8 AP-2014]